MKKVTLDNMPTVGIDDVGSNTPIFAKYGSKLIGMVVQNQDHSDKWIIRSGGCLGYTGYFDTRRGLIEHGKDTGLTFHVEDEK